MGAGTKFGRHGASGVPLIRSLAVQARRHNLDVAAGRKEGYVTWDIGDPA
jgi:hypothetical protein